MVPAFPSAAISNGTTSLSPRFKWIIVGVVFALPLFFAALTHHVWEDYYITFRASKNLAEGRGLVYQVGERVHSFTSPLGVLLPALGYSITRSDVGALWSFRFLSAAALASTALIVLTLAAQQGWPTSVRIAVICLGVVEAKTLAFTTNGMETAFLVLFTAIAWRELSRSGSLRVGWLTLGYSGLMWTRPDGCVVALAMTLGWWIFGLARTKAEWPRWRTIILAAALGALAYAPWLLWAWSYYGSPVPQTIVAKSAFATHAGFDFVRLVQAPLRGLFSETALDGLFLPIYYGFGGWSSELLSLGRGMARLAAFLWIVPLFSRSTRAASLAALLGGIFLNQIRAYPWYYAPWTLLAALALAGALATAGLRVRRSTSAVRLLAGTLASGAVLLTVAQAFQLLVQQRVIEEAGRKQIGLWLKQHASGADSVFLEPIGYVGFFSGLKILDYPGLCAPEVSGRIRKGRRSYDDLIIDLKPTWLVLRTSEINGPQLGAGHALDDYEVTGAWDQRSSLAAYSFLPGRGWLNFDANFLILRRISKAR